VNVERALQMRQLHPEWTWAWIAKVLSDEIDRWPPFRAESVKRAVSAKAKEAKNG
jgi:hypothetical protein